MPDALSFRQWVWRGRHDRFCNGHEDRIGLAAALGLRRQMLGSGVDFGALLLGGRTEPEAAAISDWLSSQADAILPI